MDDVIDTWEMAISPKAPLREKDLNMTPRIHQSTIAGKFSQTPTASGGLRSVTKSALPSEGHKISVIAPTIKEAAVPKIIFGGNFLEHLTTEEIEGEVAPSLYGPT